MLLSAGTIYGSIEDNISEDLRSSQNKNNKKDLSSENNSENNLENQIEVYKENNKLEELESISDEQLSEIKKEFENLLKELYELLSEISGLLAELGSPPDKQKLILLKEKLKQLELLRSRMRRLSFSLPHKYHKALNVDYYFDIINQFVKDNEGPLRQLALDAVLTKDSLLVKNLELSLQKG